MTSGDQLNALADPTRRSIFQLLGDEPRAVGELAELLPVSRPAVSQHLKVLADAGLVTATPRGTRRIYHLDARGLAALRDWFDQYWDRVLDDFEAAAREEQEMQSTDQTIEAVVKTRTVALDQEAAFALFTKRIASWWPVATHSINGTGVKAIRFEEAVGGRVLEVGEDGSEVAWADVLAWDPPRRFALSWHPNPSPTAASTLEVRFEPAADGGTRLTLEHGGWEAFGTDGPALREDYDAGWDVVLLPFEQAAEPAD